MRIGVSTSVIQRGKTGVAQYVFALLRALIDSKEPHEFVLFVLEEDLSLFKFADRAMHIIPVPEKYRPPQRNIFWHQTQLPGLTRKHQLDCLHIPSYRRMLWSRPCALVSTIHDLAPFRIPGKYDWRRMIYGKVFVKHLARRQHEIIAISENTARDIVTFFKLSRHKISVVPNGIEHQRFFPASPEEAKERIRSRHNIAHPFFLYVARLEHPGKNHVRLISAFEEFKAASKSSWQLVFGGSDWHGAEVIHQAIARSPFADHIRCLGFVPDSDLPELYRAADVFVYPSLYEGFGMPPLEAMACGCPVISSASGSLGEVLGEAAVIIEPEDPHTIARELYILSTNAEIRNRLRAAGLGQARKFDWRATAAATLRIFERSVNNRKRFAEVSS